MLGGQKAQFDGVDPRTGEKRFKSVSALQDKVNRTLSKAPKTTPGSYLSFSINPTVTALSPLASVTGFSSFTQEKDSLNADGFLDLLSVDFSRAVQELAGTLADLKRLAALGDLPISYEHATLKVHFPGCDAATVESLCDEFHIQRGTVSQDAAFDSFVGTDIALLFPFAPTRSPSECSFFEKDVAARQAPIDWRPMMASSSSAASDLFSSNSDDGRGYEYVEEVQNPWTLESDEEGYESLHASDVELDAHTPLEYQGFEGIYRFMEQCEGGPR